MKDKSNRHEFTTWLSSVGLRTRDFLNRLDVGAGISRLHCVMEVAAHSFYTSSSAHGCCFSSCESCTEDRTLVRFEVILPIGSDALTPLFGTNFHGEQIAQRIVSQLETSVGINLRPVYTTRAEKDAIQVDSIQISLSLRA